MPRLSTALLRRAHAIDPLLPPLLRPCRDLGAAQNELRWLREHAVDKTRSRPAKTREAACEDALKKMIDERAKGKPLQYIMGTEYFGDLEIKCRKGVLIPRQETAASIIHLTQLVRRAAKLPAELRVLDLCTGTGCIPLLFQHEFHKANRDNVQLRLLGVDISRVALTLAHHNYMRFLRDQNGAKNEHKARFVMADVLADPFGDQDQAVGLKSAFTFYHTPQFWDILISNPPYISPKAYWKTTTRSVRGYEPKLALVPPPRDGASDTDQGDVFYPRLLTTARDVEAKVVLLEVADMAQAVRVSRMARSLNVFDGIEIWRDQPDAPDEVEPSIEEDEVSVKGQGNGRSVICWRGAGAEWLGKREAYV